MYEPRGKSGLCHFVKFTVECHTLEGGVGHRLAH